MKIVSETPRRGAVVAWIAVALWSLAMVFIVFRDGARHDYVSYLLQWKLVLSGADPWSTNNAYGPLHNILAFLLPLGPLAPKLFIATALLAANALLVRELVRVRGLDVLYKVYLWAVPANCLVIGIAFEYGLNDALSAALVVFAVVARHRDYPVVSGFCLALAVLLKYYPIVLVPMFALENGRFRLRVLVSAGMFLGLGLALTVCVWGDAFIKAITFGIDRGPAILSILSALQSFPYLVGGRHALGLLVRLNSEMVAVAALGIVWIAWKARLHWLEASVLGLLTTLVTYKLGHQQFYLPWLFLVAALPLAATPSARHLAWLCLPLVLFLSVFQWGYAHGSDGYRHGMGIVRRDVGFFAFALGVATIAAYFFRRRGQARSEAPPTLLDA